MKEPKTYRKKPVEIQAMRFDYHDNGLEALPEWIDGNTAQHCYVTEDGDRLFIRTLEGDMEARDGDYIIKGVAGEFYPCKPEIFQQTYEEVTA